MIREDSIYTAYLKGAPERVANMCRYIQMGTEVLPWNEAMGDLFNRAYEHFAVRGRRVLAVAKQILSNDQYNESFVFQREPCNFPMDNFTFIGMLAIMDPPKHGVRKAIAALRTAGIQVVLVTGDHPLTAESIAKQIGLISGPTIIEAAQQLKKPIEMVEDDEYDAVVVHGEKLENMSEADWDKILSKREIVFARTSPSQKVEIVTKFQAKGHIVGVRGCDICE